LASSLCAAIITEYFSPWGFWNVRSDKSPESKKSVMDKYAKLSTAENIRNIIAKLTRTGSGKNGFEYRYLE
jgi:hypothetical protein